MFRIFLLPASFVAACLLAAGGCRGHGDRASAPVRSSGDTAFCFYMEHAAYIPPTKTDPFEYFVPGSLTVFRFGHRWTAGSEGSADQYTFEIEPGQSRFILDSSLFASVRLRREGIEDDSHSKRLRIPERMVGERTSDSTWVLQEWLSWDYREWRRRESYRAKHPDLTPGFQRVCVRIRSP